jgi:hypothetical protein
MEVCNFCQDELCEEYLVTAPDGKEMRICADCMADITTFFKTGKAEAIKLKQKDAESQPSLILVETGGSKSVHDYRLAERTRFGTRVFHNVEITDITTDRSIDPFYKDYMQRQYSSYGAKYYDQMFGESIPTRTVTKITSIVGG